MKLAKSFQLLIFRMGKILWWDVYAPTETSVSEVSFLLISFSWYSAFIDRRVVLIVGSSSELGQSTKHWTVKYNKHLR